MLFENLADLTLVLRGMNSYLNDRLIQKYNLAVNLQYVPYKINFTKIIYRLKLKWNRIKTCIKSTTFLAPNQRFSLENA